MQSNLYILFGFFQIFNSEIWFFFFMDMSLVWSFRYEENVKNEIDKFVRLENIVLEDFYLD